MALTPRTRPGLYEITDAIGAGGMGEVYKAKDSRLGRDVIKRWLVGLALASSVTGAEAQTTWLPAEVEQGLVNQLVRRMPKTNPTTAENPERASQIARTLVQGFAKSLEAWTDSLALEWAPTFPQFKLPAANQRHLDAMARFQVCNLVYLKQFESGKEVDGLRRSSLGLTAMTMAILRLRQPFLKAGGSSEQIETFLTSPPMAKVFDEIQSSADLAAHAEKQCQGVLWELTMKPMK